MKRQPKKPARCVTCGGVRRPEDDYTPAEQADPRCWICRMQGSPPNGLAPALPPGKPQPL
jgi:hypothetical protein